MATTNLTINLGVATGKMSSGFRKAKGEIQSFTASVKTSMMSGLAPFLGMLGGAMSVRAFTSFITNAQESIDKIGKMSVELGMTTEQVAGYEHAVNLSGVEIEAFAKSIDKMRDNINEANQGMETQVDAFRALGLDARAMASLSTDEQFKAIADSVQRLGWTLETAGAVSDIFGAKVGPKMAAMLMDGSAGIEAMQADAEALGLTFDGIDAAKVEIANDAMTRLKGWVEGVGRSMAVNLAPAIAAVSDLLVGMGTEFTNSMDAGEHFASVISEGFRIVLDIADILYRAFEGFMIVVQGVGWAIAKLIENIAAAVNYFYETQAGDKFEEAAKLYADELAASMKREVEHISSDTLWGEEYQKAVEKRTAEMQSEAERIAKEREAFNAVSFPGSSGTEGKTPDVAAVQRNTLEAFKAIADANKANPLIKMTEQVAGNTAETNKLLFQALYKDALSIVGIET